MRDPSQSNLRRPILAALLFSLAACRAPQPTATAAPTADADAPTAPKPVSNLERWRRTGDRAALAAAWSEQLAAEDAAGWDPLLQATAFRIAALRGGQLPKELSDALAQFASHEGLARHRRLDPRLVLPIAELLWDSRDAAGLLRLAEVYGKPPHDQPFRFLRGAAEQVAAREPGTLRLTTGCKVMLDGAAADASAPLQVAPGSHYAACEGQANRLIRVAPGTTLDLALP